MKRHASTYGAGIGERRFYALRWFSTMSSGLLQFDRIREARRAGRVGRCIEYVEVTTSTSDLAWERLADTDFDGLVVLAEYQSAGRGRLGRSWSSPKGASLLCSVAILVPAGDDDSRVLMGGQLMLLSAVAACDAIRRSTALAATIKWPNDILISRKKVAGILVESRSTSSGGHAYVIGMGINCLQQSGHMESLADQPVTSLDLESADPVDRTDLAIKLLAEVDHWVELPDEGKFTALREAWLARAEPMGGPARLLHAGRVVTGSMLDVDPAAALVVRLDDGGVRAFDAATTTTLR